MAKCTLIVTEKPDAAARIAVALDAEGKPKRSMLHGVPYYEAARDKALVIVPALGHLYAVTGEKGSRGAYPVFEYRWLPLYVAERKAKRTRVWLETISALARGADEFVDACDFDLEGSIIGYTLLKYACGGKEHEAKRMKYSTLTCDDLQDAYAHLLPTLDFSLIEAGLTRHEVDWLYGINLSRALTQAAKKQTGRYAVLSTGRVQGPTLKFVATREKKIRSFIPTPFWNIVATISIDDKVFEVPHEKNPFQTKEASEAVVRDCKGGKGVLTNVELARLQVPPPPAFDLGTLQNEAYRIFRYSPMFTSKVAQRLYLDVLISYPRTSSQKLPATIGYKSILSRLARSSEHAREAQELLAKLDLKPREGKGFDSAHPAIYPTGNLPQRHLDKAERNVWSLIVKRFMAAFGNNAVQQTLKAVVNISGNRFLLGGCKMIEEGWLRYYVPYVKTAEASLPYFGEGKVVEVKKVSAKEEHTLPLARYNPSTLLKRMQQANLGTKATRAGIIQTLYDRNYIAEERIKVTELGFQVIDVLMKHCPTVLSSSLTAELEGKMEAIQEGKQTRQQVLSETIDILKPVATKLKENEDSIGKQLAQALSHANLADRIVGTCPTCKTGTLVILHSKKTGKRFVGCTNHFTGTCKTAYPLPQKGVVKALRAKCHSCGSPTVRVMQRRRRAWAMCLNPNCPSKKKAKTLPQGLRVERA